MLEQIIEWRGQPNVIRSDNGSEMCSGEFQTWAKKRGITIQFIQPGKPTQNAHIERFNRTVRHEWLDEHLFESIQHAQVTATRWYGGTIMNDPTWLWVALPRFKNWQ